MKFVVFFILTFTSINSIAKVGDFNEGLSAYNSKNYSKAIQLWKPLASHGHDQAQRGLCVIFYLGQGVKKDVANAKYWCTKSANQDEFVSQYILAKIFYSEELYEQAFRWMSQSSSHDYPPAHLGLGVLYGKGHGVRKNDKEATRLYKRAAEKGNAIAQLNLGDRYKQGLGVEQSLKKAISWYRKSSLNGLKNAQYELSIILLDQDKFKEGVEWLNKSASQDHPPALNKLATIYKNGVILKKNKKRYFELSKRAAKLNYLPALVSLGTIYANGDGVNKDYKKALYWYNLAANKNSPIAQKNIGLIYDEGGNGIRKDNKLAIHWFKLASNNSDKEAKYKLGLAYYNGYGTKKDIKKGLSLLEEAGKNGKSKIQNRVGIIYKDIGNYKRSVYWLEKSTSQNNAFAATNLAFMYANGLGVKKNLSEAIKLYKLGAKNNIPEAQCGLGILYHNKKYEMANPKLAKHWFDISSTNNYAEADFYLGLIHERGIGVDINYSKSKLHYLKASNNGHNNATYNLALLHLKGLGTEPDTQKAISLLTVASKNGHKESKDFLSSPKLDFIIKAENISSGPLSEKIDKIIELQSQLPLLLNKK